MKLLQKQAFSEKKIPMLLLLAVGIIEFLFIILESQFSGIGYYLAETYLIVPCLLFLGYVLREKKSRFARRRLLLSVAAILWFVIVQSIHKLSGMENHPMATVFFVYLMAFPFAVLTDDRVNAGLRWIGGVFVTASLVLVFYTLLLLLNRVPAGLEAYLFWDGARLNVMWHPNMGACFFMIGIGFSAAFCMQTEKVWTKVLLVAAILLQFLAMALTNCRTTLLLTGALLGGIVFFLIFRGSWKQLLLGLLAAAVLLVGSFKLSGWVFRWNNDRLVAAFSVSQEKTESVGNAIHAEPVQPDDPVAQATVAAENASAAKADGILMGQNEQGSLSNDMRTLNGRTLIWYSALRAVRDNKALALWGTEYVGTVISAYQFFPVVHSHNSWMEALMRMGLPGLLISLVFTAISVSCAVKLLFRKDTEVWKKTIAMMTMCILVTGFLEPYLFITNVYYHVMDFLFFFCTGYLDFWYHTKKIQKT